MVVRLNPNSPTAFQKGDGDGRNSGKRSMYIQMPSN